MQCMYIKLINDENLIAMVEDTGNDWLDQKSIDMTNPVQVVSTVHASDGNNIVETFTMEQWVKFVQQATVRLPVRSILTMMSVDEKTKKHYDDFLIKLSEKFPFSIICNEGRRITIGEEGIMPYDKWEQLNKFTGPSYNISFIGVGGVLYPPGSLHKETLNNEVFQNLCLSADDLWLKTMSLLEKTTVVKSDYLSNYLPLIHFNNKNLSSSNLTLNQNDQQLKGIRGHYIHKFGIDPFNPLKTLV